MESPPAGIAPDRTLRGATWAGGVRLSSGQSPEAFRPRSTRAAAPDTRGRQELPFEPDYTGFEIPDLFVIGYGLDYNDDYRQLPYIGVMDEAAIQKACTPQMMTEAVLEAVLHS